MRSKAKNNDPSEIQIYALKSMKKEMMVVKNQVGHVRAEREALAKADGDSRWLTALHYSFVDNTHLYMVMSFLPGGDLMSLLIKEDTFSEAVTRFFMAEAAHAISSVHALGYIHRDIKVRTPACHCHASKPCLDQNLISLPCVAFLFIAGQYAFGC